MLVAIWLMVRFSACALSTLALVMMGAPSMAMEPLQRSTAESSVVISTSPLDLSSEQAHFSATKALPGQQPAQNPPQAPGEKGRVPQGHSLVDFNF